MPIREIPVIEEALSAIQLSINPPRGDMEGARLPLKPAADETGQVSRDALWLHYSPDTKISFARLNEDIAKQLADAGHPMSDALSLCFHRRGLVLAAFGMLPFKMSETRDEIFEAMDAGARSPQPRSHRFSRVRVGRIRDRVKRSVAADHVAILVEQIAVRVSPAATSTERVIFRRLLVDCSGTWPPWKRARIAA